MNIWPIFTPSFFPSLKIKQVDKLQFPFQKKHQSLVLQYTYTSHNVVILQESNVFSKEVTYFDSNLPCSLS